MIRRTVGTIERELEAELGTSSYAQLRKLLVRLNETETIRAERRTRPGAQWRRWDEVEPARLIGLAAVTPSRGR